jgi:hypothetical protein
MSGSRPGSYRRAEQQGRPAASTESARYDVAPTSRLSPRVVPGPAYGTHAGPRRGPVGKGSPQVGQQSRFDPRRFAGQLKRVVVAGSVVGFGLLFALVAEHVVGVTSVRGGTPAPGSPSQASSPYDGFFGPSAQSQSGGLNLGGIFGGSGGGAGSGGSGGSGGTSAGSGLVNGGGGAPMMVSSGS